MVDISFTIVMQWINFGLLLFLMYTLLYKPLMGFLDARSKKIADDLNEALNNKEESLKVLDEYKSRIKDIEAEADKMFADVRKKAEAEKHAIIESARTESKQIIEATKREIELETSKARAQLKQEVASLVIECSEKVLLREINAADHQKVIQDFLNA
jgi:F-type H+-transporting ATPase subunit b